MNETTVRWSDVGQTLLVIVVTAALIYLAVELRAHTRAIRASTSQAVIEAFHAK